MLLILYLSIKIKEDAISTSSQLFEKLIWITVFMLLMEIVSWQFDQKNGTFNWYANYISNMIFAWLSPLITCVWASYIDYHMFRSYERLKKRWFYLQPMMINTILIVINLFTPLLFSVSPDNVYSRESFMWLIVLINGTVLVYKWVDAYRYRHKINKDIVIAMLIYLILPSVAAIVQIMVYGIYILWPTMAMTIVISYIYLETISTSKDYLTKLMTRERVDNHARFLMSSWQPFGLAIFDLNNFKGINDTYGHVLGDEALKVFSKALKSCFDQSSIIGRYGGDEFILLMEGYSEAEFDAKCANLKLMVADAIDHLKFPFKIEYSYGFHLWDAAQNITYEALIHQADEKMYAQKKVNFGSKI